MTEQGYEYSGLLASLWDFFRGDTSNWEDRFFYREVISKHGQPVLDVGCGTGRLLLDYLQNGVDIDGVDISPEMLALCREKVEQSGLQPNLFQQTMDTLDLPRRYQTIIVPSSSFQLLTDTDMATRAMSRFYHNLHPGGVLAMPFMLIWQPGEPEQTEWELREKVRPEDGALVRRWSRVRFDTANQLEHTEDRYEISLNDQVIAAEHHQRSPATRWYSQEQATELYQTAGFVNLHLLSGFTFNPAQSADTLFCVIGQKPSVR